MSNQEFDAIFFIGALTIMWFLWGLIFPKTTSKKS